MSCVLCLDQSSHTSGYAVFDKQSAKLINYGKFTFNDTKLETRLVKIRQRVADLIQQYQPAEIAIEDIQLQGNVTNGVTTYKALAEVMGVIVELVEELQIPITIVHSATWKSTCGVRGRARIEQKRNAQKHVLDTYGLGVTQDEADAICIGEHVVKAQECAW